MTLVALPMLACKGDTGSPGPQGDPGDPGTPAPTTGTLTGVVTDGIALDALPGVTVTASDTGGGVLATTTTTADGKFSVDVTAGPVDLVFDKPLYTAPGVLHSGVGIGQTVRIAVTMNEAASGKPSVLLALPAPGDDFGYAATVALTASAADPNGDQLTYAWANTTDPKLDSAVTGSGASGSATLPSMTAAFAPRATANGMKISGYALEKRFGVIPVMTDTRGQMTAKVTVDDGRGQSTSASLTFNAASLELGIPNVSQGQLVYLNCGTCTDGSAAWTLTRPDGTTGTLSDPTAATPSFRADMPGKYTVANGASTMDIYAAKYIGMVGSTGATSNDGNPDSLCLSCHASNLPAFAYIPNRFTEYPDPSNPSFLHSGWIGTAHAGAFTDGINGASSSHFAGSCDGCHTTGFDQGVANGGFADVAAQHNWAFPSALDPGNWVKMLATYPEVARLANVQCESCHGPQGGASYSSSTAHATTSQVVGTATISQPFQSKRISYAAESCGNCHAAGADHKYTEWATTDEVTGWGHGHKAGALLGASTSLNTSCGRCHTAQGYTIYSSLLKAATPVVTMTMTCKAGAGAVCDPLLPIASKSPGSPLDLVTSNNAQPVTCVACHDPHDGTNPSQLRVYDELAMTPAGFAVKGMGKGALCISCHNSRNGTISTSDTFTFLHEDTDSWVASTNFTSYSAPHQADQGDVFVGRNAYFMGTSLPMMSKHAAIGDTCVGCHMALQPETFPAFGAPARQEHLFRITDANKGQLCTNCHGPTVDGEGIQGAVENQLAALQTKIGSAFIAKVNAGGGAYVCAYDEALDGYSQYDATAKKTCAASNVNLPPSSVVSASLVEVHGQIGLEITLASAIDIPYFSSSGASLGTKHTNTFAAQLGTVQTPALTAMYSPQGNFARAGWNYFLVEGDQSKGLHNPTFVQQVMNNTLAKDVSF
ncbi:MAG: carboxypeptidase regulatory-like domain-containing protein [Acidobacteriota bacterium]